ncbi:unnamed protein product, partial [Brassica oleracea var. botrytis]
MDSPQLPGPAILGEVISIVQFVFVIVGKSLGGHIRTHMNSLANSCSHQSRICKALCLYKLVNSCSLVYINFVCQTF